MGIFIRSGGILKGRGGLLLDEGRMAWDLDENFRIMLFPPWLPPQCRGDSGRFGFYPLIHGATNICLSYEGHEL